MDNTDSQEQEAHQLQNDEGRLDTTKQEVDNHGQLIRHQGITSRIQHHIRNQIQPFF